jgi:hypothetical protein
MIENYMKSLGYSDEDVQKVKISCNTIRRNQLLKHARLKNEKEFKKLLLKPTSKKNGCGCK